MGMGHPQIERLKRRLNTCQTKRADAESMLEESEEKLADAEAKLEESQRVIRTISLLAACCQTLGHAKHNKGRNTNPSFCLFLCAGCGVCVCKVCVCGMCVCGVCVCGVYVWGVCVCGVCACAGGVCAGVFVVVCARVCVCVRGMY